VSATYTSPISGPALLQVYNWKEGPYSSLCVSFIDNIRVRAVPADFAASPREISCAAGGTAKLALEAGAAYAHAPYVILSGLSGTWPGMVLNQVHVPLNPDPWTLTAFSLINTSCMVNFMADLDGAGKATAKLNTPVIEMPEAVGLALFFDYLVLEPPGGPPVKMASLPVYVLLIP
jgi:hypothetical protein